MPTLKLPHAVEARNLTLQIGGNAVVNDVSFAIPTGRYVGIIGPNGGGKTTLLRMILGLQRPTAGTVAVFGADPLAARNSGAIGYVPQRIAQADIPFPVTVDEMVWSGRTPVMGRIARRATQDREAVERAMECVGIAHLRQRLVGTLSGGERQRVFIARSLAAGPRLLILDEPTTGVDMTAKEEFYALLKLLNAEWNLTILFVSHDIEVMTSEVAFVLALNQKLICHCESHAFLEQETVKRLYGKDFHSHSPHLHL
jgi:zinc transport system ATP-binding protein